MRWNMRRGEISMEVIIIAAIALLVLVILSVLLLRQTGNLAEDCQNVGGRCQDSCDTFDGEVELRNTCSQGLVCCRALTGSDDNF
jgi:hypothetical protein